MSPLLLSILLAAPMLGLASCVPDGPAASSPAPSTTFAVSRDINKLGQIITLPRRPLSAVWQMKQIGDGNFGPSDYTIQAVLQFSPRDLQALVASAARRAPSKPGAIAVESWFPNVLKQKAAKSKNRLRAQRLDPSDFTDLSFNQGELWRIEGTNYLFVSLLTS